jgi:N-dimethylarginine dimethylaminohydrolase
MINFLNIGNNTVLTCNRDLKNVVKHTGVNVIYIEFRAVMNMYGALHCATQVARKI